MAEMKRRKRATEVVSHFLFQVVDSVKIKLLSGALSYVTAYVHPR